MLAHLNHVITGLRNPLRRCSDAGGAARLADLGLARKLTDGCSATLTGETGTYKYMAPEVRGSRITAV